jgi:hypothetical protein
MYRFLRPAAVAGFLAVLVLDGRAQITETPVTVKPGHFLLEMDALSLSIDRDGDSKVTAFGAASTFITTGVTQNWDVQLGAQLLLTEHFSIDGESHTETGVGDVYVRTKWRFYESSTTYTSIALLPYVKIPTNSGGIGNDAVEGGVIVPWETRIWGDFHFHAMAEVSFLRNADDDGYDSYWYVSSAMDRQLTKQIGVYAEAAFGKSSGGEDFAGTLGAGVTYALTENMWFDLAAYRGLSSGAEDWNYVLRFNFGF